MFASCQTVSSTVPSTHFTTATGLSVELRLLRRSAANLKDLALDVLDRTDRQLRSFHRIQQILPSRIDGNSPLSDYDVDQFAGTGERGHFVHDHGNAIAERGDSENGASCERGSSASRRCRAAGVHRSG